MEMPLERQLTMEGLRREAARIHPHDLIAAYDFLLCHHMRTELLLEQAMRRVTELELREATMVNDNHRQWAQDLLADLGE